MGKERPARRNVVPVAFAVLLAVVIGLFYAGQASAVDQGEQPAKDKNAPKSALKKKGAPKNAAKDTATGPGSVPTNTIVPGGNPRLTNAPGNTAPNSAGANPGGGHNSRAANLPKNIQQLPKNRQPLAKNGQPLPKDALPKSGLPRNGHLQAKNIQGLPKNTQQHQNAQRTALDHRRLQVQHRRFVVEHRRIIVATRLRLPQRPMIGQAGFTGVPHVSERRYVSSEMVFHVGASVSRQQVEEIARRHGMSIVGAQGSELTGGTLYVCRADRGQQVAAAVRAMEAEKIGVAQPNYVFTLAQNMPAEPDKTPEQDETALQQDLAARPAHGDPSQYVVTKLKLGEVHRLATGSNVLIAVIDSKIDINHPDLAGTVVEEFDTIGRPSMPDAHGTGMAGAIVAQRKLMGIAPGSKILAIHAFATDGKDSGQATTKHILAGIEYAIKKGARVINMSFAGPYDPMLQLAMKKAHEKGVVLIAAAGNAGPKSPPLYPAADANVIAVTATDENDKLFTGANQGPQVAVAAPGVNILEPAPNAAYQLTTGTSVAAAHVSGVAALLLEKNPSLTTDAVFEILTSSAKTLAAKGRDDQFGWGLVDPGKALAAVEERIALDDAGGTAPAAKPAAKPGPAKSSTAAAR